MSLYNMLFGVNPLAGVLMKALDLEPVQVPRFRDCYLNTDGDEPRIAVYTRTGGGNRACYEKGGSDQEEYNPDGPFNDDLRALPGFLDDRDDDFDNTYATFFFKVPEAFAGIINELNRDTVPTETPEVRWSRVLTDLGAREDTPEVRRAREVGKVIAAAMTGVFEK